MTLFFRVAKRLHRHALGRLAPLDLTPSQGRALREITDSAEPLRIADLAGRLNIAPRSATEVVDALENAGLVTRLPNPADRRTLLLAPTPRGQELRGRFTALSGEAGRHLFSCLSDAEQHQLFMLLTKIDNRP
ncbi:MAG TPA: MarR family transcriptional regulator [Mycobacteriales bacterium]|nr:MarR family transcriptional regulator [Mycobacteriales bacterium]